MKLTPEQTKVIFMWIVTAAVFLMVVLGACDYINHRYHLDVDVSIEKKAIENEKDAG